MCFFVCLCGFVFVCVVDVYFCQVQLQYDQGVGVGMLVLDDLEYVVGEEVLEVDVVLGVGV